MLFLKESNTDRTGGFRSFVGTKFSDLVGIVLTLLPSLYLYTETTSEFFFKIGHYELKQRFKQTVIIIEHFLDV